MELTNFAVSQSAERGGVSDRALQLQALVIEFLRSLSA